MDRTRKKKTIRIAAAVGGIALSGLAVALFAMSSGHAPSGPPQNDMAMDQTLRNEVIEGVIAHLNKNYVFPEKAAALEKQVRARMRRGEFEAITSAEKFAETLTEVMQKETQDKHLEIRYLEKAIPEQTSEEDDSPEDKAAELIEQQRFNFGFSGYTRLRGNIGYLDVHQFGRPQGAADRIAAMMSLVVDAQALIIDLRQCGGGDPETVMLFASYLFDKPTHLNDLYWRDENRTDERWTAATVPGKRYGEARKVYLLTGRDTFSGCEDLAYALKNNQRATLVGETTGGGAHAGGPRRVTAHFKMFVPSGRPINPITHTDWEGVGVVPDVKTAEKNALDVAQLAALKHLVATETDPEWKARLQRRVDELD